MSSGATADALGRRTPKKPVYLRAIINLRAGMVVDRGCNADKIFAALQH
jgi:hypothetical protein